MSCRAGDGSEAYFASLSVALLPHEMGSPGDLDNV